MSFSYYLVPQLLEMMVDLDDDSEWSTKDTIDEEEDDRLGFYLFLNFQRLILKKFV